METQARDREVQTYTTLSGEVLDLTGLTGEERSFFARCYDAYRAGMRWGAFSNLVSGLANPLVRRTGGIVTAAV